MQASRTEAATFIVAVSHHHDKDTLQSHYYALDVITYANISIAFGSISRTSIQPDSSILVGRKRRGELLKEANVS